MGWQDDLKAAVLATHWPRDAEPGQAFHRVVRVKATLPADRLDELPRLMLRLPTGPGVPACVRGVCLLTGYGWRQKDVAAKPDAVPVWLDFTIRLPGWNLFLSPNRGAWLKVRDAAGNLPYPEADFSVIPN